MTTYTAELVVRSCLGAAPVVLPVPKQPDDPSYLKRDQAERKLERVARMIGRGPVLTGHIYKGGNLLTTITL